MNHCRASNDSGLFEKEKSIWMATFLTELIVIVLINLFTLATFARNPHLRKRSTYLVINLTIADLLLGVAAVLSSILKPYILESLNKLGEHFSWYAFLYLTLRTLFPAASLANLSLISLERLHATIYPFRHCLIREQVYFAVITFSWLLALLFASMMAILVVLRAQFTLVFLRICVLLFYYCSYYHSLLCYYYFECQKQPSIIHFWIKAFSREEAINNLICNDCGLLPDHSTLGCLGSYAE